jgi:hypothetical protein
MTACNSQPPARDRAFHFAEPSLLDSYSGLVNPELVQELPRVWVRLDEKARGANGEPKLRADSGAMC